MAEDQGIVVASPHDAELWAEAMDRAVAASAAPVHLTPEWRSRYDWQDVAQRVATELDQLTPALGREPAA